MRRLALVLAAAVLLPTTVVVTQAAAAPGKVRAGVAAIDATWHVGASAGQYAGEGPGPLVDDEEGGGLDPHVHATTSEPSYGIESRTWVRALVVEGPDGTRFAQVSNDLYIPQDLLNRRTAEILLEHDRLVGLRLADGPIVGIDEDTLNVSVTHSHTSSYYSSPSWGVWAFQDVFDVRFFEWMAQRMAEAVIAAADDMVVVRVGAAQGDLLLTKRHSYGPAVGTDGTPAGHARNDTDPKVAVVRFDDISKGTPRLLANWVIWGRHPEDVGNMHLHSGEFVNAMYRMVDRELGGTTLFSQNDTGASEIAKNAEAHPPALRQEFDHRNFNQLERAARPLADIVEALSRDVATVTAGGSATRAHTVVPARSSVPVDITSMRFAPPGARPSPTVSNCRSEHAFELNPAIPVAGLPDCEFPLEPVSDNSPVDTSITYDMLREAGIPVPDNYGAPSVTGLEETVQVRLVAIRIGDIAITVCPCEMFTDQGRNIVSRLDRTAGNLWYGWDWTANYNHPGFRQGVRYDGVHGPLTLPDANGQHFCTQNADTTWTCRHPSNPAVFLAPVSDEAFMRMKAQIYNDARGWDDLANSVQAESEPVDLAAIWGNFTHEELHQKMTGGGYHMVITVGMSNDYWGYTPSYREMQRGDHYRKALNGLGYHGQDFYATRLSRMAATLKGAPAKIVKRTAKDDAYALDAEEQRIEADAFGNFVRAALPAYEATLPADGGQPRIVAQPSAITRFEAATVEWIGGSNFTDSPYVRVQRCKHVVASQCQPGDASDWAPYGDSYGEVQVMVDFPDPAELATWEAGTYKWGWTAQFEAYDSDIPFTDASGVTRTQTPVGTYRFVIDGCHRDSLVGPLPNDPSGPCRAHDATGRVHEYHLTSKPFRVGAWDGITVSALEPSADWQTVTFDIGPNFPYPTTASNTDHLFSYPAVDAIDYQDHPAGSPFPYIRARNGGDVIAYGAGVGDDEVFCFDCSFETWADTGAVASASVTVERAGGSTTVVPATYSPTTGRWSAAVALAPGDSAWVSAGSVHDTWGETNGATSPVLTR